MLGLTGCFMALWQLKVIWASMWSKKNSLDVHFYGFSLLGITWLTYSMRCILTKSRDAWASLGYADRHLCCGGCPIGFCRLQYVAVMTVTGLSTRWCCPSMFYSVFFCYNCHLLFPALLFSPLCHVCRRGLTAIACKTRWLRAHCGSWSNARD